MDNNNPEEIFIEKMNNFLATVDLRLLNVCCNSPDNSYAKETLKTMHDLLVEAYGTDRFDFDSEWVTVPAIIKSRNSGLLCLGLVTIDLESSGEHWGTFFLTPIGVIDQGGDAITEKESKYLKENYLPYDYWYTANIGNDIHVDFDTAPDTVREFISYCRPDQPGMIME